MSDSQQTEGQTVPWAPGVISDTTITLPAVDDASDEPETLNPGPHGPFSPEMWDHLKAWVRRELHIVGVGSEESVPDREAANP